MFLRAFSVCVAAAGLGAVAGEIEGTIVVQRQLTKKRITSASSLYQRGVTVPLEPDPSEEPLAYERSRVVLYLEGPHPCTPASATMEQKNRRFSPDILVIPAGSTVSFPNLDPIFHNVFSLSKPRLFDLGNYPKDHTRTVTFPKPGIVFVHCHLHPNMAGVIVVSPNQWSTRADEAGRFLFSGVPAGVHTVVAWHQAAGFFRQTVKLEESQRASARFLIPLAK